MLSHRLVRHIWSVCLVLLPLMLFVGLCAVYGNDVNAWSWAWIPSLDIQLSIKLDGLSMLFASLISGIGVLIQIYSAAYMRGKPEALKFQVFLTLFMLSMLGLVLSDNILLLFVFWELTTLTSYLLIGFNHEQEKSRKNALQAMLVTGFGGLAMLAGFILLGQMAGTYNLSAILQQGEALSRDLMFTPSLVLILLGALTKSAQFPFHFWLPGAMAAPTPVSAYLHSATMVKAGIYLLARVSPIYSDSALWFDVLATAGGVTAVWSAMVALRQTDLKLMLAFSTNTVLGILTFLLAFGTDYATTAALLFLLAHALYKAALFMVVGNIDKATGTREMANLAGLRPVLMCSFIAASMAAWSKAGAPVSMGFLGKEYAYKAGLGIDWWVVAVLLLANILLVAMACIVVLKPFLGRATTYTLSAKLVEKQWGLWVPPMLLAACSIVTPFVALGWLQESLIAPTALVINPEGKEVALKLWQGVNTPLILSLITLAFGVLIFAAYRPCKQMLDAATRFVPSGPKVYDVILNATMWLARLLASLMQQRQLTRDALMLFVVLAGLLLSQTTFVWPSSHVVPNLYIVALALILCAAAMTSIVTSSRLLGIASLSVVGFVITLVFMIYSAPDVAKTQLLVETLVIVFLALVMRHLPHLDTVPKHSRGRRTLHAAVAAGVGVSVTLVLLLITSTPLDMSLSDFFAQNSVPGGHGRNIVNVILVDFRAFDTLGEILVVVVSALATIGLLSRLKQRGNA